MKYTSNYSLRKPDITDMVDIDDFNTNADKIDTEIKKLNNSLTENISNLTYQVDNIEQEKATRQELNALGRLQFSGQYNTLEELRSAKPTGGEGIYLVLSDGYTYRWSGTQWTKAIQFQSSGIGDDSITWSSIKMKSSVHESVLKHAKIGYKLANVMGEADVKNNSYIITDFIEIDPLVPIVISHYERLAFYDKDKTWINAFGLYEEEVLEQTFNLTTNIPNNYTNIKYMKVCCKAIRTPLLTITQNGKDLVNQVYGYSINNLKFSQSQIDDIAEGFSEKTIDVSSIKSIDVLSRTSENLFNKENTIIGSWVYGSLRDDDGEFILDSQGNKVIGIYFDETANYSTGFIPCEPNTRYTKTGVAHNGEIEHCPPIFFFDSDYQPISTLRTLGQFTTPSNARYMSGYLDNREVNYREYPLGWHPDNYVIVKGDRLPDEYVPYEDFKYTFNGLKLEEKNFKNECIPNSALKPIAVQKLKEITVNTLPTENLFNKENAINGHWCLVGESISFTENRQSTGFIPCKPNTWYVVTGIGHLHENSPYVTFFDSNKNPILCSRRNTQGTITPFLSPSNAAYISGQLDYNMLNYREYPLGWHPDNYVIMEGKSLPNEYTPYQKLAYKFNGLVIGKEDIDKNLQDFIYSSSEHNYKNHKNTCTVFSKLKDFNSTHFRIPFMCVTNLGTIIAGCDIRYNTWNDHSLIDLGTARSEDGGKTWIDKTIAIPNPGVSNTLSRVMDGTILATREGRVFLIGNKFNDGSTPWTTVNTPNDPNWDCVLYHSDDDGRTWQFNQSLKDLLPEGQISFLGGVGSGIQMKNGTLVFPIQMARGNDNPFNCQSGIIYSIDGGDTWSMSSSLVPEYTSECSIVEYPTGTIMINCRQEGQNHRSVFKTTNLGSTWEETPMNTGTIQTNTCQGHMCKVKVGFDKEVILFTNPVNDGTNRSDGAYAGYDRSNLSLSILQNDSKFTPIYTLYRPHSDGYSCMAFDERRNRLYVLMELEHNLVFKDITDLLPTIQLYKNLELR